MGILDRTCRAEVLTTSLGSDCSSNAGKTSVGGTYATGSGLYLKSHNPRFGRTRQIARTMQRNRGHTAGRGKNTFPSGAMSGRIFIIDTNVMVAGLITGDRLLIAKPRPLSAVISPATWVVTLL